MNILIYSTKSVYAPGKIGGAETSLNLLAQKLSLVGHSVVYFTQKKPKFLNSRRKTINGVNIVFFPYFISYILSRVLKKRFPKLEKSLSNIFFIHQLNRELKRRNIDIVYTYYELDPLKHIIKIRKANGKFAIVMRMAGLYWYEQIKKNISLKEDYEELFNSVDSINYISDGLLKLTIDKKEEIGFNLENINHFIGDIGVEKFKNGRLKAKTITQNKLRLLVATRFSPHQKRQDILIEAARLIKGKFPFEIIFVGDGTKRGKISNMVYKYGLTEIITIIPFMPQKELWNLMYNVDVLCHPCDYEGLSKIIIESMMMGLPVLASNVLPISDYIKDGINGYITNNTPEEWASKIANITNNKHLLHDVSRNAEIYASTHYNADTNIMLYQNEFEKIVSQKIKK